MSSFVRDESLLRFFRMTCKVALFLSITSTWTLVGCSSEESTPYHTLTNPSGLGIVRRPQAYPTIGPPISSIPTFDPASVDPFQVDLRGRDLSAMDLSNRGYDLNHSTFDSKTAWPITLPDDFAPADIMEAGKNPGLGVRSLHQRGINGRGIGIAIIDQALLVDHVEYGDRVKLYEEVHWPATQPYASMHGAAVASIAVGNTVGVAPQADLYFIANAPGTFGDGTFDWNFTWLAQSIDRILAVNAELPAQAKIRVLSISLGWSPEQKGYDEMNAAVARASQAGIFVISTAIALTNQYRIHGLGRAPLADPDQMQSYGPGRWWANDYYSRSDSWPSDVLMAPMDSRTAASFTGEGDYFWGSDGGWSWVVPYLAGVYALACQVRPDMTPDLFWSTALKTGATVSLAQADKVYSFGKILDPVELIDALSK